MQCLSDALTIALRRLYRTWASLQVTWDMHSNCHITCSRVISDGVTVRTLLRVHHHKRSIGIARASMRFVN